METTDLLMPRSRQAATCSLPPSRAEGASPRSVTPLDRCVAARIRSTRQYRGMSQGMVADRLRVSFQQVQKYENGTNRLSVSSFVVVAEALGVPPAALLERCLEDLHGPTAAASEEGERPVVSAARAEQTMRVLEGFGRLRDARAREQVLDFLALLARDMHE